MNNNIYVFIGVTNSKSAISESFSDLIRSAPSGSHILHGHGFTLDGARTDLSYVNICAGRLGYFSIIANLIIFLLSLRWQSRGKNRVLVTYSTMPVNWLAALLLKADRFYFWSHDPVPHTGENFYNSQILPIDLKISVKFLRAKLLCGSTQVRDLLIKEFPLASSSIALFPYISALVESRTSSAIDDSLLIYDLIFFGRMEEYKGIRVFVESLHRLNDLMSASSSFDNKKCKVVFAGKGPLLNFIKAQKFGSFISVEVLEFPSNDTLKSYLLRSQFCCLPYTDATGSQVMQSALSLGCNIICSRIPLFEEIAALVDTNSVRFFSPSNATELSELIHENLCGHNDIFPRDILANRARNIYSPLKWSDRVASFYE